MATSRPVGVTYYHLRAGADTGFGVGGQVVEFTAAAALNVGDAVYLSAANNVNKSGTLTDYSTFVGIVVGGKRTNGEAVFDPRSNVLTQAAAATESVLVQLNGIAWAISGSALTPGVKVAIGVSTPGRLITSAAASAAANQNCGLVIQGVGANGFFFKLLIEHS